MTDWLYEHDFRKDDEFHRRWLQFAAEAFDGEFEFEDLPVVPMTRFRLRYKAKVLTPGDNGIDISHYQKNIDWPDVRDVARKKFVFVKAAEGLFVDPEFKQHWADAKDAGLLRGAYYFFRPDRIGTGVDQAKFFLAAVGEDQGDLPMVVDVEDPVTNSKHIDPHVYSKTINEDLKQFCEYLKLAGVDVMIYTRYWYWVGLLPMPMSTWASQYKLWIASYPINGVNGEPATFTPRVPPPWTGANFWQYSGGDIKVQKWLRPVAGIGYCDENRYLR